ncbi:orotate phosphoribosyltransferase [Flavobacterium sp. 7E]|uniref:metallophosphoesterase n=1 Tax=Flavobacterium sp. 7E TaxID=2735898 RepID=UPI001570191E|nr:metallophosphoesterase [Flavobacterium sp. 7E]NRS88221.1 orotate phosphoribosyltransferase [Flavobacterium sp. 7E]
MNSIILHISDLHVSLENKVEGERINEDSYLKIPKSKEPSQHFIDKFIIAAKEECNDKKVYLLVTGDISDCGAKLEFDYALIYLNAIIEGLKIEKENILLIPGDHDINRKAIEELKYSQESFTNEELNNSKFKNFSDFYFSLLNKSFDCNKVLFDVLNFENEFILLGINSSHEVGLEKIEGQINIEVFKDELVKIENSKNLKFIACCHHNVTSSHEDKNRGQWEANNRLRFLTTLEENGIKYIFSGNEHTSGSKKCHGDILVSDSGALSSIRWDSAFKIYELDNSENIILKNNIFALQKPGTNDAPYYWDTRTNSKAKQDECFTISFKNPPQMNAVLNEIPEDISTLSNENEQTKLKKVAKSESNIYYSEKYTVDLYEKVKELNLYHSGHFHWSETSRAHNWIDVSKLIEEKENLNFVKNAIVDVIENKNIDKKIDLIIGLGYEGNIISSKAAIKFNKPYAFLPYSYRHDEHHDFENELNFDNSTNKFKSVLIVTDVVNDGRTIRKLINKRQKIFFSNVDKVYVISLFYTGESVLHHDILNYDFIKTFKNYDIENDEEVNNIEFYTVKSLKVEKCPYGKDFRESCLIVKDNLGCVNMFYDESKYLK